MPKRCAVDGCRTGLRAERKRIKTVGGKQISVFSTPKDPNQLEQWNNALPGNSRKLSFGDFVCQLHFRTEDIDTDHVMVINNETIHTLERGRYRLNNGAIPFASATEAKVKAKGLEVRKAILTDFDLEMEGVGPPKDVVNMRGVGYGVQSSADTPGAANERTKVTDMLSEATSGPTKAIDAAMEGTEATIKGTAEANKTTAGYSLESLAEDLRQAKWKEGWMWLRKVIPASIELIQYDTLRSEPRIHCSISENMELTISSGDKSVARNRGPITSFAEMIAHLVTIIGSKVCVGTGLRTETRAADCPGFLKQDDMYRKRVGFERCRPCRALRRKFMKKKINAETGNKLRMMKKMRLLTSKHRTLRETTKRLKARVAQIEKTAALQRKKLPIRRSIIYLSGNKKRSERV